MANNFNSWDLPGLSLQNTALPPPSISNPVNLINNPGISHMPSTGVTRVSSGAPPPLPPRLNQQTPMLNSYNSPFSSYSSPYNTFGGYGSSYGTYGSSYGGYGGYGSYGGLGGYGYRPGGYYGNNMYPENRFIQAAEESSRPAFQTIQSVLQAFSSVTMMFESTFHAIQGSYMSVLGVADNFGRIRSTFGQVFSTFAAFRAFNWLIKKLLYLIGIRRENPEDAWNAAAAANEAGMSDKTGERMTAEGQRPSWAVPVFLAVLTAGPYLLYKLISQLSPPEQEKWTPTATPGVFAVGLYDFRAGSQQELNFRAREQLMIAPKQYQPTHIPGWILACNSSMTIGLVPGNYIALLTNVPKKETHTPTTVPHTTAQHTNTGVSTDNVAEL